MKFKLIGMVLFLLLPFAATAQNGLYTIDHIDGLWNTDTLSINTPIVFHLRTNNNTSENIIGQTNGFRIYSDDGATWNTTIEAETGAIDGTMFEQTFTNLFSIDGAGADTVGFAGFRLFMPGIPAGFNEITYTITIGPIDASNHKKTICIDSTFYPPASAWTWSTPSGDFFPDWNGPYCFTIFDPSAPVVSNLVLSDDILDFYGVVGGDIPSAQQLTISSDGDPLFFTLTENADWLVLSPIQGTTASNINVLVNTIGLSAGSYSETIIVASSTADNSPQEVVINLVLEEPPPSISVSDNQFFFNAVQGESNPPSKILTITNGGGNNLNWTVTNNESWLSLSPLAGVDSNDVTVSIDITGLTYGDYEDTIIVSDPLATNDPVKIPVFLGIGSDLPIIQVLDTFNFVNVPAPTPSIPPWTITIQNGGAGTFNFWLEENSPRILTMTPSSGVSPQSVEIGFKVNSGSAGDNFWDTVWVHSNEAINSPVPVIFFLHFTEEPATLWLSRDTVSVFLFECDNGAENELPSENFVVDNIGGDDPMFYRLHYESDLFTLSSDSGIAPQLITLAAIYNNYPVGTYLDTIVCEGINSINRFDTLIVKYNIISGLSDPEIWMSKQGFVVPVQENSGPTFPLTFEIRNAVGGCMEWEIQEDVSWLFPSVTSGNVPTSLLLGVNPGGLTMGFYQDSLYVVAPEATNSPDLLLLILKVWRFHGDWDYDGDVHISDLVANVNYLFNEGPDPQPERIVGDLNCDRVITINDLTYMVSYLFEYGPIPCGNPY